MADTPRNVHTFIHESTTPMTKHTKRGSVPSVWQDDGFGNLQRVTFASLIARIVSGWREI